MKKLWIAIGIVIVAALLFASQFSGRFTNTSPLPTATPITKTQQNQADIPAVSTVASGLEVPWAIAFLPDNSMLVAERPGRVRMITSDGKLLADPVGSIDVVRTFQSEGGLLGLTLHPDFSTNHFVYVYYTYNTNGQQTRNRVSRFSFENNTLTGEKTIVDAIPGALFHNGGRIQFGPDKLLYITTGDSQEPSFAQDRNSLAGKILRITDTGEPAPGNPFGNRTYSYGHRNPQGIAWDANGTLWETEHGRSNPTGFDEINLITAGKNYGWEVIQGDETRAGMETPKRHSGANGTWAPAGTAIIGNSLFYTGLKGQALYEAIIRNNEVVELKEHLKGKYGRIREVTTGPDGMLYISTSNKDGRGIPSGDDDKILRINPSKL